MKTALIIFLVTLITIIGIRNVMASMTMPTLMNTTNNVSVNMFSGSVTIGGGLLAAGGCVNVDGTVTGATVGMVAIATPVSDPGSGVVWNAFVKSVNTVTVKLCGIVLGTPPSLVYNIRVAN